LPHLYPPFTLCTGIISSLGVHPYHRYQLG
jgi:hypothetical protein